MANFAREEQKLLDEIAEINKEVSEGDQKKASLEIILDNFKKENLHDFLHKEVESDQAILEMHMEL